MSTPLIQGWCPGALRPMPSGDGLVVRVRPPLGRLTTDQAAGLADLAARHGNGRIDLSLRANLQIRGVSADGHPALIEGLRALGLVDPSIAAETRRNVVISPFWTEHCGTRDLARALTARLVASDAPDLPAKFGFAIDSPEAPQALAAVSADIRIRPHSGGWLVHGDGFAMGATAATAEEAADLALALARWFVASGGVRDGRGRMVCLWADLPAEERRARLPAAFRDQAVPEPTGRTEVRTGPVAGGWLVGAEFGQITAAALDALAQHGAMRMTPWRMLLVEGARDMPDMAGLITRAGALPQSVSACTGAPGCPQARGDTRGIARRLAAGLPDGFGLHVSGCAKGCAHPGPARAVLVATAPGRYDLILNGRAGDAPYRQDLDGGAITPADLIPGE
ncbi:precorrin-3B synthase [Albidovulum inexpectatum]|uniref:Precorrin-3B synthase n=1 Tax=Albidovulum inexpectatum TaxID=196587 RepID=A0A2S5JLV0_9RHOB|nr:precorrin-3B synthase [Albidovulum inexpectatum]PPB82464.1 precorrin-3B synthase [Albidovulum inexpectatum]